MKFSVFILISALLSSAFASPIPVGGLTGAANLVTAAARFSSKAPKPKTPVRSQSLPARIFPGAIVNARPIDVKNLPILPGKNGNPNPGAEVYHPGVVTGKRKDGSWDIVPFSHTAIHPSKDSKTLVDHPHLDGHAHLGHDTHIAEKDIRAATGARAGGKENSCRVLGLCNERLANDPNRPKPVRTQSLPPPKLEHHDKEEHNPEEKTHRKGDSS
jgi:hypothetical protein